MGGALQRASEQARAAAGGGQEGAGRRKIPRWLLLPLQIGVMYLLRRGMQAYMATGGLLGNSTGVPVLQPPPGHTWPTVCAFAGGQRLSLFVYTSHSAVFHGADEGAAAAEAAGQTLVWCERGLAYDWSAGNDRAANVTVRVTPRLLANESVYAHVFLVKGSARVPRTTAQCRGSATVACRTVAQTHMRYNLTEFSPPPKPKHLKHLITGQEEEQPVDVGIGDSLKQGNSDGNSNDEISSNENNVESSSDEINKNENVKEMETHNDQEEEKENVPQMEANKEKETEEKPWIMLWKPSMDIRVLADAQTMPLAEVPDMVRGHWGVDFEAGVYWPPLVVNTLALRHEAFVAVNGTVAALPLALHFAPISLWKFTLAVQMEQQLRAQARLAGGRGGEAAVEQEIDDIKSMLTETSPVLLAVTAVVSLVHSVFDFLAFKNDISFWRARKSMAGVSVRTLFVNVVSEAIIFLYLLDNETSWMILVSSGVGLAIDAWKITRACVVRVRWTAPCRALGGARVPYVTFSDKESYTRSKTKAYDEQAMRYLYYLLVPCVVGYSLYSLLTDTYKSWYSWVLASLCGAVYTFGFIMMTPQLFINYKLKSVAHLPWRALVYKTLNTFIDDLFAFIIKMPTMHRLACFRDDIVFFIYLYQRWKYPVDKSRLDSLQWEDAEDAFNEQKEQTTTTSSDPQSSSDKPKEE